jgi:uncharacterized damage-inducible protein DinB
MISQSLLPELKHEIASTRKMLARIPFDKWDWKPHEKSFSLGRLTDHVAELVNWLPFTLSTSELDFAKNPYQSPKSESSEQLLANYDRDAAACIAAVEGATDEQFMENWTMRNGDQVFFTMPKAAVIRTWAMNHLVHHRGQLSVYLRLLDVPVPGMYGPTADES